MLDSYDSDPQATHVVKVPLADEKGNVVETEMEMDGHKAFRTIYSLAKRAGYFKNGEYDAAYRRHTDPYARAQRIQSVINKFYDTKKSGKSATFAGVVLDVRRDGSIGIVNTKKETVGELDDALKDDAFWVFDRNLTIPYDVVRSVVNQLDDFCNRALVTPTEEQLTEKLQEAYNSAMDAHDNAAFNANFLNSLSRSIEAQFNPVVNEEVFGDARAKREFLEKRGLEVSPDLIEKTENGRIRADFKVIEASIKPNASMYRRNIMQGTTDVDDRDFMAIAEE